jgi:hypothetical protein
VTAAFTSFGLPLIATSGALDPELQELTIGDYTEGQFLAVVFATNVVITAGLTFTYGAAGAGVDPATAGWTLLTGSVRSSSANTSAVWVKRYTDSDTGKIFHAHWTAPTTARSALLPIVLSESDGADLLSGTATWLAESGTGATVHPAPVVTDLDTVGSKVYTIAVYRQSSLTGWTVPAGWTSHGFWAQTASGATAIGLFGRDAAVDSGSSGAMSFTSNVATPSGVSYTFAVRPAPAPVEPTPGTEVYRWYTNTTTTARVRAKVTGATSLSLRVVGVGDFIPTSSAAGRYLFDLTGLAPGTTYSYRLVDTISGVDYLLGVAGRLITLPDDGTVKFSAWSCITTNAADSAAMDALATWAPDWSICTGDFHYSGPTSTDPEAHIGLLESQIAGAAGLKAMLRDTPADYLPSDHDTSNVDNADSNNTVNGAALTAYKDFVPHYPLVDATSPLRSRHHAFTVPTPSGGVRFIMPDIRNLDRTAGLTADGPSKTPFGAAQEAWLASELERDEQLKIIFMDVAWMGPASTANGEDKMWSYADYRNEFNGLVAAAGANIKIYHGDSHLMGYTRRENNDYGDFPVVCSSPMHNTGGGRNPSTFDEFFSGPAPAACRQFVRSTLVDDGTTIEITDQGYDAITGTVKWTNVDTWDLATGESWSLTYVLGGEELPVEGVVVAGEIVPITGVEIV